jgi:hypothetical protein
LIAKKELKPESNKEHKDLVISLLMTCADLAAMFKPWKFSRKTADLVYTY